MDLSKLPVGQSAHIKSVAGTDSLSQQIKEMGFVPGSHVTLLSRGPFRSPFIVSIRGTTIALRKNEAERVLL